MLWFFSFFFFFFWVYGIWLVGLHLLLQFYGMASSICLVVFFCIHDIFTSFPLIMHYSLFDKSHVFLVSCNSYAFCISTEEKNPESEDVFMEEDVVAPSTSDQEMRDEDGGWSEIKETLEDVAPAKEEEEEVVPDETIHESSVGKGLAGALKLLKDRGTLKETIEWGGRNMDKKKSKLVGIHENDGGKEIRIERTDEYGRIVSGHL